MFAIFALLHVHAWRQREPLELNELERYDTLDNVRESMLNVAIGAISITMAQVGGSAYTPAAGMIYWLVGPAMAAHGFWSGARRGRLRTRLDAEGAAALEPAPG